MANELDVIESLKHKEEELERLLNDAREKALQIKKDALEGAEEIRSSMSREIAASLENYKKEEMKRIEDEAEKIKKDGEKKAQDMKLMAEERLENAVEMAVWHIIEGK